MSGQSSVVSYPSGAASLFSVMARTPPPTPPQSESMIGEGSQPAEGQESVTCAWCLSDDTEMVDHDQQIYRCCNCGELFERPRD